MIGARVAGKYELRRLLGTGAMGSVYEAVHSDLGKRVAIKLTHHELAESVQVEARFRREARAVSAVESDYIVQIFDFGRDPKLGLYMVIEYLEGEDLEARLARERWISDRDTATVGVQIGRGLARAHAAGIVHRDLKPANVFLTRAEDGTSQAKLLDFGISKVDRDQAPTSRAEPTLTSVGATVGTPQYMSPEQCEGKASIDGRADVWALAAVLYEMIAGEAAISEVGGQLAVMLRILRDDVPPLRQRAKWVNAELAAVIDAGLVRDRNRRIPDAATLVARLLAAMPDVAKAPPVAETEHRTDVSELAPTSDTAPPEAIEPPPVAQVPRVAPLVDVKISDTGNPTSANPPSSDGPSSDDLVTVFSRGEMPVEIAKLRKKKRS